MDMYSFVPVSFSSSLGMQIELAKKKTIGYAQKWCDRIIQLFFIFFVIFSFQSK